MSHTSILLAVLLLLQLVALPRGATAQQRRGPGIGVIFGEPMGLSLKTSQRTHRAFDAAAFWRFDGSGYLRLHGDVLFHKWNTRNVQVDKGRLGLYYGAGGRVILRSHSPRLGIRVPLGLSYLIGSTPLEIFLESAPILDLTPERRVNVGGGMGFRIWLN